MKRKMTKLWITILIILLTFTQGCSLKQLEEYILKTEKTGQSLAVEHGSPRKNITEYSNSLIGLRDLIQALDKETIYVAVEPIINQCATNKIPENINVMVESSINMMGGNRIKLIPFSDRSIERYSHQNLFIVHGAITEFDSNIMSGGGNVGAGAAGTVGSTDFDAEGSKENGLSFSSIGIDFSLLDYRTGQYKDIQIRNKMNLLEISEAHGIGFSINGNGLNLNANTGWKQGEHAALRLLVELSMVELIGRFYDLPYWICIYDGGEIDKEIAQKMMRDFHEETPMGQTKLLQKLLAYVYDERLAPDGINGRKTKAVIVRFKREYGILPANGSIDERLYVEALKATASKFRSQKGRRI